LPPNRDPAGQLRPWSRVSTFRLETFRFYAPTFLLSVSRLPDLVVFGWLVLLVVGGRSAVRVWLARHRRRTADLLQRRRDGAVGR